MKIQTEYLLDWIGLDWMDGWMDGYIKKCGKYPKANRVLGLTVLLQLLIELTYR